MIPGEDGDLDWASLLGVVLLGWLGVALAVGTVVGRGIAFGTRGEARDDTDTTPAGR